MHHIQIIKYALVLYLQQQKVTDKMKSSHCRQKTKSQQVSVPQGRTSGKVGGAADWPSHLQGGTRLILARLRLLGPPRGVPYDGRVPATKTMPSKLGVLQAWITGMFPGGNIHGLHK
jgi:hypothetical protein